MISGPDKRHTNHVSVHCAAPVDEVEGVSVVASFTAVRGRPYQFRRMCVYPTPWVPLSLPLFKSLQAPTLWT